MSGIFAVGLTPGRVREFVAEIAEVAGDPEVAHDMEDSLRREVLTAIAINQISGADAQLAALYALASQDIEFPRRRA